MWILRTKKRMNAVNNNKDMSLDLHITLEGIDELVYELYGITEEERKIIENGE